MITKEYTKQTGKKRKITALQLGYESRCAKPHAFDVMLGCQLGVGAYRALVENGLNGVMVSVSGQLQLQYVPFEELVDPSTLVTVVRYIETDSDFHQLTRFLETYVNEEEMTRRQIASHAVELGQVPCEVKRRGPFTHCDFQLERMTAQPSSVPLVLGTPGMRGSDSTAIRSARAVALKIASLMWWLLRP